MGKYSSLPHMTTHHVYTGFTPRFWSILPIFSFVLRTSPLCLLHRLIMIFGTDDLDTLVKMPWRMCQVKSKVFPIESLHRQIYCHMMVASLASRNVYHSHLQTPEQSTHWISFTWISSNVLYSLLTDTSTLSPHSTIILPWANLGSSSGP